jgi:oligopeptide transport system substrate-binding protein
MPQSDEAQNRMRRAPQITIAALTTLFAAGVIGMVSQANRSDSPMLAEANRHKILLQTVGSEPTGLDPDLTHGVPELKIESALFEGLVNQDPKDSSNWIPGVAESWEHSGDYSTWTFHLRKNAKWSNGDPVSANDFVFSINRVLTPSLGSPFSEFALVIRGAEEYLSGKIQDFGQVGVKAVDDQTVRFDLNGPGPYFLALLSLNSFLPVHMPTVLKFGTIGQRDTKWTAPENFVGNGPFVLKSWRKNDVIEVVKSGTYWDADRVRLNGINFYSIESLSTADRAFRAGQLHITQSVPLDMVPFYRREKPEILQISPALGVYLYVFNVTRKPLDDPKVRLALSLAVDRESLVRNVLRGNQLAASGYVPPGIRDYAIDHEIVYDPDRARLLLAQAGYPGGHGFPKLDILINTSESHRTIAEAIQQMWREELNIEIGIQNQEWKVYLDSVNHKHYEIARSGLYGLPDPAFFLQGWTTGSANNSSGWANTRYDSLLHESDQTGNLNKRLALLHQAEQLFLSESVVIPIYWYTSSYLLHPSVLGWYPNATDIHPYKFVDLKPLEELHETKLANKH